MDVRFLGFGGGRGGIFGALPSGVGSSDAVDSLLESFGSGLRVQFALNKSAFGLNARCADILRGSVCAIGGESCSAIGSHGIDTMFGDKG